MPRGVKGEGEDVFAKGEGGVGSSSNGSQACHVPKYEMLGVLENFPAIHGSEVVSCLPLENKVC